MAKAAVRFKRVAEAFDIAARERSPVPETFTDLSELVNTFIDGEEIKNNECALLDESETSDENQGGDYWENCIDLLRGFLKGKCNEDDMKLQIQEEVELACRGMGVDRSLPEFKRRLMISLRERGFDAGKSFESLTHVRTHHYVRYMQFERITCVCIDSCFIYLYILLSYNLFIIFILSC